MIDLLHDSLRTVMIADLAMIIGCYVCLFVCLSASLLYYDLPLVLPILSDLFARHSVYSASV